MTLSLFEGHNLPGQAAADGATAFGDGDLFVTYKVKGEYLILNLLSPDSASVQVDVNHNRHLDAGVDTAYGKTSGSGICTQFLLGRGSSTYCGTFRSRAQLASRGSGFTDDTWTIPIRELSPTEPYADVIFSLYRASVGTRSFPSDGWERPFRIAFTPEKQMVSPPGVREVEQTRPSILGCD